MKLGRDLEEGAGKDALARVVLNAGEPKECEPVLAKTLGCVWVAKAQLGRVDDVAATLNVFDELREGRRRAGVSGLKV